MIKITSACKVILRNWERQIQGKNEDCFLKKCSKQVFWCLAVCLYQTISMSVTGNITLGPANRILSVITLTMLCLSIFFYILTENLYDKCKAESCWPVSTVSFYLKIRRMKPLISPQTGWLGSVSFLPHFQKIKNILQFSDMSYETIGVDPLDLNIEPLGGR